MSMGAAKSVGEGVDPISMTWPQYLRGECALDGRRVRLRPIGAQILCVLMMRRGQIVSHDDLIEAIYPDPDNSPSWERNTLTRHIFNLNRDIPGVIATRWGRGYELPLPAPSLLRAA